MSKNFFSYFDIVFFGLELKQIFIFFVLIIISILFNSVIANFIVNRLKVIVKKTVSTIDDKLFEALLPPCKFLPIVIVFFITMFFWTIYQKFTPFICPTFNDHIL